MHIHELYRTRKADWERLTRLLDQGKNNIGPTPEQVQELGSPSSSHPTWLSRSAIFSPPGDSYLNQLVGRAHATIYRSEPMGFSGWRSSSRLANCVYRQAWPFVLVAALLFLIPAALVGLDVYLEPQAAYWLLPPEYHQLIPLIEQKELWVDIPSLLRPFASSFIMQNNIRVAFLAFSGGVLCGLMTIWVMVMNGLILGGITGLTAYHGVGFELWTFVIGHGMIELSVIIIAGGSGLMLGWALLHPGLLRRRDALALAARQAVTLLSGCVPLLVIAGLIEGFISPAEGLPWAVKWIIGLGSGILLYAYLLLGGRERRAR
jgi:uncharacterized membrane protein SpoIIM required for sporulation